jgi:hypothetical protein
MAKGEEKLWSVCFAFGWCFCFLQVIGNGATDAEFDLDDV